MRRHSVFEKGRLIVSIFLLPRPLRSTLFPYTTLFRSRSPCRTAAAAARTRTRGRTRPGRARRPSRRRSEEHTSELQSRENLVCRLLLEKKKATVTPNVFDSFLINYFFSVAVLSYSSGE